MHAQWPWQQSVFYRLTIAYGKLQLQSVSENDHGNVFKVREGFLGARLKSGNRDLNVLLMRQNPENSVNEVQFLPVFSQLNIIFKRFFGCKSRITKLYVCTTALQYR